MIDFTQNIFDDNKEFRRVLTEALVKIENQIKENKPLPKGMIVEWALDSKTVIPSDFKKADGQNKTYDAESANLIKIQKI